MGSLKLTKKERIAARSRVKKFRAEFAKKPEHTVVLDVWHCSSESWFQGADGVPDEVRHCGSVGCVGGFAEASPLFTAYKKKLGVTDTACYSDSEELLNGFFGVTAPQANKRNLFGPKLWSNGRSDKAEALSRIDGVIKFHTKQLEAK